MSECEAERRYRLMATPLVSVIVLAYNSEKNISHALESILRQDFEYPYEVLVGNDASQDGTADIIAAYRDRYPDIIVFVDRATNVGAAYNAYDLLMRSRGKYLAFCEGDDFWLDPRKLRKQVGFLEDHPEFIGCAHKCLLVDENEKPCRNQGLPWVKYKDRFTLKDFSGGRFLPGQTASIVKRNIFLNSEEDWSVLYTGNKNISDRIANLIYLLHGDFHCMDDIMSAYRCINRHKGENLTSLLFRDNPFKCPDELLMTEQMENYALEKFGKDLRFSRKRADILRDSLIELLRYPDAEHVRFLIYMIRASTLSEWLVMPLSLVEKIANKLKGGEATWSIFMFCRSKRVK